MSNLIHFMKNNIRTPKIVLVILLFTCISFAQKQIESEETERLYHRKSISFYDEFLITEGVSIPKENYDYLVNKFREYIVNHDRLVRFDRNPIPTKLMEKAKEELAKTKSPSIEKVGEILEKTFAPEILKIVNLEKELRAKNLVTKEKRNNFLTNKAKEIGTTAEDLEKVMNAAYVIVPYIYDYNKKISISKNGKDIVEYSICGGILVFHLEHDSSPKLKILDKRENVGATSSIAAVLGSGEFTSAVYDFILDFEVLIRDIFKLSSEIVSTYKDKVFINLGKEDGISLDDKFNFIEFYEDKNGNIIKKMIGHGFVTKVGQLESNKGALYSQCQIITGNPEKGMFVVERPRAPIEGRITFVSFPVKIRSGSSTQLFSVTRENTQCFGFYPLFMIGLDNRLSISDLIGSPQIFLTFNLFGIGWPNATLGDSVFLRWPDESAFKWYYGNESKFWYVEVIGLGLLKKFYFRRIALGADAKAKLMWCDIKLKDSKHDLSTGVRLGGEGGILLEFVLIPDVNLGGRLSHGLGKFNTWSGLKGPEMSLQTIGWEVYLAINPKIW